jgi:hypothetical protein
MKKPAFSSILVATLVLVLGVATDAQQTGKVFRIGILDPTTASGSAVSWEALRQELSKLGWIEGKKIAIEYRYADRTAKNHKNNKPRDKVTAL